MSDELSIHSVRLVEFASYVHDTPGYLLPLAFEITNTMSAIGEDTYIYTVLSTYVINAKNKVFMDQCSSMFTELRYAKRDETAGIVHRSSRVRKILLLHGHDHFPLGFPVPIRIGQWAQA